MSPTIKYQIREELSENIFTKKEKNFENYLDLERI